MGAIIQKCTKCGKEQPLDEFPIDSRHKTGHRAICYDCYRARTKELHDQKKREKDENPLSKFQPRELIAELRRRGYRGELELVQKVVI